MLVCANSKHHEVMFLPIPTHHLSLLIDVVTHPNLNLSIEIAL